MIRTCRRLQAAQRYNCELDTICPVSDDGGFPSTRQALAYFADGAFTSLISLYLCAVLVDAKSHQSGMTFGLLTLFGVLPNRHNV